MRRWPLLALVAVLLVLPSAPAQAQAGSPPVVVVGVAGLTWDDVGPQTPVLRRLAERAAVGVLSVKALRPVSCRADGWLTLGAGTRAEAYGVPRAPCGPDLPRDLDRQAGRNAASRDGARLGALVEALDGRVELSGDGARLAARLAPAPPPTGASAPVGDAAEQPALVRVVDAGSVPARDGAGGLRAGGLRAGALRAVDDELARVVAGLDDDTDLLVVGLSAAAGEERASLHVALAVGPSFPRGSLRSASTRRAPYVQLVDVAPTVLALLDREVPDAVDGQPWQVVGDAPSVAALVDLDRKASAQQRVTVPFFLALLAGALTLLALVRRRPRAVELVLLSAAAALGASYVANLVPWWRSSAPLAALLLVVAPMSAGAAAAALRACRHRPGVAVPAQLVCSAVAAVLVLDLLAGAPLQMSSVAGYSPLVAGRFAGIGNVAFGVLAAAVLLAASALTRPPALAAVALLVVVVDGAPPFGSDVGGVLALVPAFVLLGLLRTGTRVTPGRLALAGAGAVAVVSAFAVADWTREPAGRTHLGRFVQDLLDGTAGQLLARKAAAVVDLLTTSALTLLLPVVAAVAVLLVARPPAPLAAAFAAAPGWRHGLLALGMASLLGFALNDSGAAVPALALAVAVPATLAVVVRARRLRAGTTPPVA